MKKPAKAHDREPHERHDVGRAQTRVRMGAVHPDGADDERRGETRAGRDGCRRHPEQHSRGGHRADRRDAERDEPRHGTAVRRRSGDVRAAGDPCSYNGHEPHANSSRRGAAGIGRFARGP